MTNRIEHASEGQERERVVLVPGGARGLGRATALQLATAGWSVAIFHRGASAHAEQTCRECERCGAAAARAWRCDVTAPGAVANAVAAVEARLGRIDALVNAVGPFRRRFLLDETVEAWRETFDSNLHPVFYLVRAVSTGMMSRGWGRIINFGVVNADRLAAQPHVTAYSIAKLGVLALTRSLAQVLAPHGVTVNAISPGFIDSGGMPQELLEQMGASRIPAGRMGQVDDVVGAVLFLLSDEASYITGTNLHVSGGWGV